MTPFGTEWQKMLAAGLAPRENMFAETHSPEWLAAREFCRKKVKQRSKERMEERNARA